MREISSWKLSETRENALHNFFVGGSEELRDLRHIALPAGFDGPCLNKHGLQTDAGGRLTLRLNTIMQQEQFAVSTHRPRAKTAAEGADPVSRSSAPASRSLPPLEFAALLDAVRCRSSATD